MAEEQYSEKQLFEIGKTNYDRLALHCQTLEVSGYWEQAGQVMKRTSTEILDLYVQTVLMELAICKDNVSESQLRFACTVPISNPLGICADMVIDENLKHHIDKSYQMPPVLIQLCSLYDKEKEDNITEYFIDALLNIVFCMACLNGGKKEDISGFMKIYYSKINYYVCEKSQAEHVSYFCGKFKDRAITCDVTKREKKEPVLTEKTRKPSESEKKPKKEKNRQSLGLEKESEISNNKEKSGQAEAIWPEGEKESTKVSEKDNGKIKKDAGLPEKNNGKAKEDAGLPEKDSKKAKKDVKPPEKDNRKAKKDVKPSEEDNGKAKKDAERLKNSAGEIKKDSGKPERTAKQNDNNIETSDHGDLIQNQENPQGQNQKREKPEKRGKEAAGQDIYATVAASKERQERFQQGTEEQEEELCRQAKAQFLIVKQRIQARERAEAAAHEKRIQELMGEMNALVGLESVKKEIQSLINLIKVRKMRKQMNLPEMDMSYHMVFTGSPGTGKTTVARLVAKIYKELGILSEGNLVETDRSGLVAGYVGQTAMKVHEIVEQAIGGILFIDEAYSLSNPDIPNDFGPEAVDTLVKLMEDHRDNLVIIVAGYTEEMQGFLKSNSGLISRFNKFIDFPDYSKNELVSIMNVMAKNAGLQIEEDAQKKVYFMLSQKKEVEWKDFGNARGVRNLFEKFVINQANRLVLLERPTKEDLITIKKEDIAV